MNTVKDLPKSINKYLIRNFCIPLKKETKRFLLLFETSKESDKERIVFFLQNIDNSYTEKNIYFDKVKGCNTIKNSKDSKIFATNKNSELKKSNLICYEMSEAVFDNLANLAVKIAEEYPEMKDFLEEQKETQRLISHFYKMCEISDKKVIHNNKFIEYFSCSN